MTWQTIFLDVNAIVCMLIVVRLMFFSKSGRRHRPAVAVMAYLIILSAGYIAFSILFGKYLQVDPGELFLNIGVCIAVWRADGNLAKVVKVSQ
ncbi:phage holin family protein [Klebsiella aerogenes]